jgi:uncharacterized glyoxalase superfamily protein PhnB
MTQTLSNTEVTMYPALRYRDAAAAVDWLVRAFGLRRHQVHPGPNGTIVHAELAYGGSMIMLGSARVDQPAAPPRDMQSMMHSIYMYVPDPDAHYAQAKAAGADILYEPRDTEYGSREYGARDLEGNIWSFGTYRPGASA